MKNLFNRTLVSSIAKCIHELVKFQEKLSGPTPQPELDPLTLNKEDYFESNEEVADFLGVSVSAIKHYKSKGYLKSALVNGRAWFKITDVTDAVSTNNIFKSLLENIDISNKKLLPKMTMESIPVSKRIVFTYLSYQGWHVILCTSFTWANNSKLLNRLCREAILARHSLKPFKIPPQDILTSNTTSYT